LAYFNMKDYQDVIQVLKSKDSQRERVLKAKAALFLDKPSISRSFLTENSDDERYLIGLSYFLESNYQKAFKYFDSVSSISPIKPKAILKAGDALYNAGNTEYAKEYYYQLLQKYPNSEYAKYATLALIGMGEKEISEKDMERLIENYLSKYPQSPMADELKYQLAQLYIKNGKEKEAKETLTELISTPLKYKAILKLAELEESADKRMVLLYKVYREGDEGERTQARDELINIYTQVGDRKSIADILMEGSNADKVKAIGMYLSMGDDENARKLAKELIQNSYRDNEFEGYLLELYKLSGDADYLNYLKESKDKNIRAQALYLSGMNELKRGDAKKALEYFVDISVNYKGSSVYNQAIIEGAKVLISMNARHDASCFLNKADKDMVTQEELDIINSIKGKLPKCEVK
ncbi:MAG: tetratricopeptide repeat protein, partial [Aquificaceae bacterium]